MANIIAKLDAFTARVLRRRRLHLPLVLLACLAVYWPLLTHSGLRSTEGHRAIPGWTMLQTGQWFPTRLFEAAYLRKPPLMPWMVAVYGYVLGPSEFSARAVSATAATLSAVAVFFFARRWFGGKGTPAGDAAGLAAGLAQVLLPRVWPDARLAHIESLLCFTTQLSVLFLADMLLFNRSRSRAGAMIVVLATAASLIACVLTKLHAGLAPAAGVIIAACILQRSLRPLVRPRFLASLGLSSLVLIALYLLARHLTAGELSERENPGDYMWANPLRVPLFALEVLGVMMPATLWAIFPWGPEARAEPIDENSKRVAQGLAWAFVLSLAVFMIAGTSNARYGNPAMAPLAPLAGYVAAGCVAGFTARRVWWARLFTLGSPVILLLVLLGAVAVQLFVLEPIAARRSSRDDGIALGRAVDHDAEVWSSQVLNAKPELPYYARQEAAKRGVTLRPRWLSRKIKDGELPPTGTYLLLMPDEGIRYRQKWPDRLRKVMEGVADRDAYEVYVVE